MNYEEISINSGEFEYIGKKYDCHLAIKHDIESILREAKDSHKDSFNDLYDETSLKPEKIRFFTINGVIAYCMIIYIIRYKDQNNGRYACGNYYPISDIIHNGKIIIVPHPFQASICW